MIEMQILYLVLIFLAVAGSAFGVLAFFSPRPVQERLKALGGGDAVVASNVKTEPGWHQKIVKLTEPVAKLAVPAEGWEGSGLRTRFMHAGYRNASAPGLYFGAKAIFAFTLPALFVIFAGVRNVSFGANAILMWLLVLAAIGYYLPNVFLARKIRLRQRELFEAFPDAMDLIMVCVEAGLSLDAAIGRAGEEIRLRSPDLADEFHLVTLELRAGATRERALRNLALRTGLEEVGNLVAMLVQADRFGTNVADSLRVHSDTLRTKRRLRAEEAAAKIPLKLLFPLIFCIFPSLLLVLLGPAFIRIYRILLPTLSGG
jgi:tight adherence protein C